MERYSRQSLVQGWDQKKLLDSKVAIAGVGALGNIVAQQLAMMGVGHLYIMDKDFIEESNLSRQPLYSLNDLNKSKVEVAKQKLEEMNPDVKVCAYPQMISFALLAHEKDFENTKVVLDCLDNLESRLWLNEYCVQRKIPLVSGGVYGFRGQLQVVIPGETACLQCNPLMVSGKVKGDSCSKEKTPSTATTCYTIASFQANETIKLLMGIGEVCKVFHQYIGDVGIEFREIPIKKKQSCSVCSKK